jgi:hypothetical protein
MELGINKIRDNLSPEYSISAVSKTCEYRWIHSLIFIIISIIRFLSQSSVLESGWQIYFTLVVSEFEYLSVA